MVDAPRFHTENPAMLREELERLVIAVQAELRRLERRAPGLLFAPSEAVNGATGRVTQALPRPGQLMQLSPALGPIDVMLPPLGRADFGAALAFVQQSTAFVATLRPPHDVAINGSLAAFVLPSVARAYIVLWDGFGWWMVNDA